MTQSLTLLHAFVSALRVGINVLSRSKNIVEIVCGGAAGCLMDDDDEPAAAAVAIDFMQIMVVLLVGAPVVCEVVVVEVIPAEETICATIFRPTNFWYMCFDKVFMFLILFI